MKWKNIPRKVSSGLLLGLLITALSGTGCGNGSNGANGNDGGNGDKVVSLQISRFTTSSLSDARADEILDGKSTILQTNDGTGDVECGVVFTRDGPVTVFDTGNGVINSRADFQAINSLPGNVKVVCSPSSASAYDEARPSPSAGSSPANAGG